MDECSANAAGECLHLKLREAKKGEERGREGKILRSGEYPKEELYESIFFKATYNDSATFQQVLY